MSVPRAARHSPADTAAPAPELEPMLLNALKQYPELETEMTSILANYYDEIMPNKEKAVEYYTKLLKLRPDEAVRQRLAELSAL